MLVCSEAEGVCVCFFNHFLLVVFQVVNVIMSIDSLGEKKTAGLWTAFLILICMF